MKIYFAPDKIKHFVVGLAISTFTVILGHGLLLAFLLTALAGACKELFDWLYTKYYKKGRFQFEVMDFVITAFGFVPVWLITLLWL